MKLDLLSKNYTGSSIQSFSSEANRLSPELKVFACGVALIFAYGAWKYRASLLERIEQLESKNQRTQQSLSYAQELSTLAFVNNLINPKQAAKLLSDLLEPFVRDNKLGGCGLRNSPHVFCNLYTALKDYAENGDLEKTFEPSQALGMGSSEQPKTVRRTFLAALDPSLHGGLIETVKLYQEDGTGPEENRKLAQIGHLITCFIKSLNIK